MTLKSLKRSYEMFLSDVSRPPLVDQNSQAVKLARKINTEYKHVKEMPAVPASGPRPPPCLLPFRVYCQKPSVPRSRQKILQLNQKLLMLRKKTKAMRPLPMSSPILKRRKCRRKTRKARTTSELWRIRELKTICNWQLSAPSSFAATRSLPHCQANAFANPTGMRRGCWIR